MRKPDYYAIFGVSADSTPAQISRAYRTLMRTHHPDVGHARQGSKMSDAGSPEREYDQTARGQGARNVPVRRSTPAQRQEHKKPADISVTPVRWESGPWA